MTKDTVQEIQDNIKVAKQYVDLDKALERLESNKDFQAVIGVGYLEKEAVRLVHLKGDAAFQTPERQAAVLAQIDAIGMLLGYFRAISFNARQALKSIEADEVTLEELAAEEAAK